MANLIYFQQFLVALAGAAVTAFSIYFAIKKIGHSISCSYSVLLEKCSAKRIDKVVLINNKNRSVNVFSVAVIINEDIFLEVEKFDVPVVLGPYEAKTIETEPVSEYRIGEDKFEPRFGSPERLQLFVFSDKGAIRCKSLDHPSFEKFTRFGHLQQVVKCTNRFNGRVYDDRALFAVTCQLGDALHTMFVDRAGFINDSVFSFNMVRPEDLASKETLKTVIEKNSGKRVAVDELQEMHNH